MTGNVDYKLVRMNVVCGPEGLVAPGDPTGRCKGVI